MAIPSHSSFQESFYKKKYFLDMMAVRRQVDRMTSTTTRRVIRGIAAVAVMSAVLSLALVAIHSPEQVM
jgi:hypothetical protein